MDSWWLLGVYICASPFRCPTILKYECAEHLCRGPTKHLALCQPFKAESFCLVLCRHSEPQGSAAVAGRQVQVGPLQSGPAGIEVLCNPLLPEDWEQEKEYFAVKVLDWFREDHLRFLITYRMNGHASLASRNLHEKS